MIKIKQPFFAPGVKLIMFAFGFLWLAFLTAQVLNDKSVTGSVTTPAPAMYHVGDYGYGHPDALDVKLCPGEVVYSPYTNIWTCESQQP